MRSMAIYVIVFLTKLLAVSSGFAIPHAGFNLPDQHVQASSTVPNNADHPQALAGGIVRAWLPISTPKAPLAKSLIRPRPTAKPHLTSNSNLAIRKPSEKNQAPKVAPNKPLPPAKLLPFTKEPRHTKAIDVCDLPGFNCDEELEVSSEALVLRDTDAGHAAETGNLEKRSSPRTYSVALGGGTPTMMMTSLPYPLEAKLFPAGSPKVILDFETDDVRDARFKAFTTPPKRTHPSTYIVEHILELQSIKLFIRAAIQAPKTKGVSKLSEKLDLNLFTKHWGTSNPQVQQKIATRPKPFPGYNPSAARSSLNDLIFEALGSTTNTADFVLCEQSVNSIKAKMWSHIDPFESKEWQKIAKDAADGSIPRNHHLTVLRSILGVHNYMNTPEVTKRLQESIRNVKIEFGNFKAITGEDVKNTSGRPVDLPALWVEFMSAQLKTFTKSGTEYLSRQIAFALPLYKAHVAELRQALKRLTDEDAAKATPPGKAVLDRRIATHNALVTSLPAKITALSQCEVKLASAKKASEAATAAAKAATLANRSRLLADKQAKSNAKKLAVISHYKALVAKGRHEEDIIKLRPADLTALIRDLEADIKQMMDYSAAAAAMKVPKAE